VARPLLSLAEVAAGTAAGGLRGTFFFGGILTHSRKLLHYRSCKAEKLHGRELFGKSKCNNPVKKRKERTETNTFDLKQESETTIWLLLIKQKKNDTCIVLRCNLSIVSLHTREKG
jgi:hypothetical protein